MDINTINEAIYSLENSETNFDNVSELAMLYIVKQNYQSSAPDTVSDELTDIFPYYKKYQDTKIRYQLGQTSEGEVINALKFLCQEIREFIETLYCNTDMNKERLYIRKILGQIIEKCNK